MWSSPRIKKRDDFMKDLFIWMKPTWISVLIGLLFSSIIDTDWIGVEGLGIISGNWIADVGVVLTNIGFFLLVIDDDVIVIDRVIVGGFTWPKDRCGV